MPRLLFDFQDGDRLPIELAGLELVDAQAVRGDAMSALKHAMFFTCNGQDSRTIICPIRNESGRVICWAGIDLTSSWGPRVAPSRRILKDRYNVTKTVAALLACLGLSGCANPDGSKARLSSDAPATSAGFNGGYAGTNYGFSNLNTKSAPF